MAFSREVTVRKKVLIPTMKLGAYAADRVMGGPMLARFSGSGVLRRIIVFNETAIATAFKLHIFEEELATASQDIFADDKAFGTVINLANQQKAIDIIDVTGTWVTVNGVLRQTIQNLNIDFNTQKGLRIFAVTTGTPTYAVARPLYFKFYAMQNQ